MRGFALPRATVGSLQGADLPGNREAGLQDGFPSQILPRIIVVVAVYFCFHLLSNEPLPWVVFTLFSTAAAILCALNKPWRARKITRRVLYKILESGALHMTVLLLWSFGLRLLGPLRTLMIEGAELPLSYLLNRGATGKPLSKRKKQGLVLMLVAYTLVAMDASVGLPSSELNTRMVSGVKTRLKETSHNIDLMRNKIPRLRRKLLSIDSDEQANPGVNSGKKVANGSRPAGKTGQPVDSKSMNMNSKRLEKTTKISDDGKRGIRSGKGAKKEDLREQAQNGTGYDKERIDSNSKGLHDDKEQEKKNRKGGNKGGIESKRNSRHEYKKVGDNRRRVKVGEYGGNSELVKEGQDGEKAMEKEKRERQPESQEEGAESGSLRGDENKGPQGQMALDPAMDRGKEEHKLREGESGRKEDEQGSLWDEKKPADPVRKVIEPEPAGEKDARAELPGNSSQTGSGKHMDEDRTKAGVENRRIEIREVHSRNTTHQNTTVASEARHHPASGTGASAQDGKEPKEELKTEREAEDGNVQARIEKMEKEAIEAVLHAEELDQNPIPRASYRFSFLPFLGVCSVATACLTHQAMLKTDAKLRKVLGSEKWQCSISLAAAGLLSLPLVVISSLWRGTVFNSLYSPWTLVAALTLLVVPYQVESYSATRTISQLTAGFLIIFLVMVGDFFFGYSSDGGVSFFLVVALPIYALGLLTLAREAHQDHDVLDLESSLLALIREMEALIVSIPSSLRQLRAHLKETRDDHESWQLFSFLIFQALMVFVEALYGSITSSLGLLTVSSDTLLCCCALFISLVGARLADTRGPSEFLSYGYERTEPVCAFINCVLLVFVGILVFLESVERSIEGALVEENRVLVITAIGCCFNCLGLLFFPLDRRDLSIRTAFLHILANTLASGSLFVSTALRRFLEIYWADGLISALVGMFVLASAVQPMILSADCLILRVPVAKDTALKNLKKKIQNHSGVVLIHSIHLWSLTSSKLVLSMRVFVADDYDPLSVKAEIRDMVMKDFQGAESVIQVLQDHALHGRVTDIDEVSMAGASREVSGILL
ncbi:hypothetical protein NDN08_007915 [Rhodosorus marinus]|uniref:Cation efflux protein cytoplasmic domain-containing protein n=1 Tax=Rhodosorus marinus TaxID=101924 RepID=A0AAV8V447_9RHOD|nr:hypothetical protein NDN08_007915 [Rhodosorus marinus]